MSRPVDQKRRAKILEMRRNGMKLRVIGEQFNPPISRQAVYNVLRKIAALGVDTSKGNVYKAGEGEAGL